MIKSRICELLNIEYPVIQGGMAWVTNGNLAAAVSEAGGLGQIASGSATADWVREQIRILRSKTDKTFGVNIMLMSPFAEDIARLVIEEKVPVVTTGAGNPGKYIEAWKEAGIKIIPVIPATAMAKRMQRAGADAIIAEGMEAGGHIGEMTTMSLIPQVVDAVSIPVIAAGGIGDSRGMAAAFMLGAEAVQLGTRFLVAEETEIHENYKNMVLNARDTDSVVSGRSTGHPVRALKNKFTRTIQTLDTENNPEEIERLGAGALRIAVQEGDLEHGSFMAGQIAGLVKEKQTCGEIVKELIMDCEKLLKEAGANRIG